MEGKAEGEVQLSDVQVAGECTNVPTLNTSICNAIYIRRAWDLRERLSTGILVYICTSTAAAAGAAAAALKELLF